MSSWCGDSRMISIMNEFFLGRFINSVASPSPPPYPSPLKGGTERAAYSVGSFPLEGEGWDGGDAARCQTSTESASEILCRTPSRFDRTSLFQKRRTRYPSFS